ncbi:MAG: DNA-formamidopyrimidine glycosylase family protein, partial [Gaiellaceae bacterium]
PRRPPPRCPAGVVVPEGDSLHRAAERIGSLAGEVVAAESPHPRAASLGIAERIDGRRLERVDAVGKHLLLSFEGDLVLRSHLRMRGRWRVLPADSAPFGRPWLVLRGRTRQAVLWHGPVLELTSGADRVTARLGPDIMRHPPDVRAMIVRLRAGSGSRELGDALLDQRLVAGIGNMWKAEGLHACSLSPWLRLAEVSDAELERLLLRTAELMRAGSRRHEVYRRAGRPCRRCGAFISLALQGETARTAYWCPTCQAGTAAASA